MAEPKKGWWESQSRPLNPRQDYYLPGNEPTDVTFMLSLQGWRKDFLAQRSRKMS